MTEEWRKPNNKKSLSPHDLLIAVLVVTVFLGGIAYLRWYREVDGQGLRVIVWIGIIVLTFYVEKILMSIERYRESFMTRPLGNSRTGPDS